MKHPFQLWCYSVLLILIHPYHLNASQLPEGNMLQGRWESTTNQGSKVIVRRFTFVKTNYIRSSDRLIELGNFEFQVGDGAKSRSLHGTYRHENFMGSDKLSMTAHSDRKDFKVQIIVRGIEFISTESVHINFCALQDTISCSCKEIVDNSNKVFRKTNISNYHIPEGSEKYFSQTYSSVRQRFLEHFFFSGLIANEIRDFRACFLIA